ncbi:MAG: hypothetical protein AAFY91_17415, partial [Bacteroidota bacterium]
MFEILTQAEKRNMDEEARELFTAGKIFESGARLKETLSEFGLKWGFTVTCANSQKDQTKSHLTYMKLVCSRYGERRQKGVNPGVERQRTRASIKCGCSFFVTANSLHGRDSQDKALRISNSFLSHSGSCAPGPDQLVNDRSATGGYTKLPISGWLQIITLVEARAGARQFRSLLQRILPSRVVIDSQRIANIRAKARRTQHHLSESQQFNQEQLDLRLPEGLDGSTDDFLTGAEREVRDLLRDTLQNSSDGWLTIEFLETLKQKDDSFDFRVAHNKSSHAPVGLIWQTGHMRAALEDFSQVIFLDVMKKKVNKLSWPYLGPCGIDSEKKVCVFAEAIIIQERQEAYEWVVRSMFEMAPQASIEKVSCFFSDYFLPSNFPQTVGATNATHFYDAWHLLKSVFPSNCPPSMRRELSPLLQQLVYADTKTEYDSILQNLLSVIPDAINPTLRAWLDRGEQFAWYSVKRSFSLLRHGSSHA